jgi:hypothetical protein
MPLHLYRDEHALDRDGTNEALRDIQKSGEIDDREVAEAKPAG